MIRDGPGTQVWLNQQVYEGEWRLDKREGQGKIQYPGGGKYEGTWK